VNIATFSWRVFAFVECPLFALYVVSFFLPVLTFNGKTYYGYDAFQFSSTASELKAFGLLFANLAVVAGLACLPFGSRLTAVITVILSGIAFLCGTLPFLKDVKLVEFVEVHLKGEMPAYSAWLSSMLLALLAGIGRLSFLCYARSVRGQQDRSYSDFPYKLDEY
jgi:hypothetical protein